MSSSPLVREPLEVKLDYVTFRMDVVNELAKSVASSVYEQEVGLSLRELRLMRFIAKEPGLTVTRLVEHTHVEKTLTSKSLAALTRRDLVARTIGENDARQTNLYLTVEGARRVQAADRIGTQMEAGMLTIFSESDAAFFKRCLEVLYDAHRDTEKTKEIYLQLLKHDSPGHVPVKSAK